MGILETLVVELGPAIAKSILALWMKDPNLSPNLTTDAVADFIGFFKGKTGDVIAQRRAARQFVDIGERVAESLMPIFDVEAVNINKNGQVAVILAIKDTLTRTTINANVLAERNLDPSRLTDYFIQSSSKYTQFFSTNEHVLYERILSECSQFIVDIASQLPHFRERTLAEILKRDSKLIDIVNQILVTVQSIKETSRRTNQDQTNEYFESEYRRNVERKLGRIQLFGVDASVASTKYGLSIAYITLMVNQFARYRDDGADFITVDKLLLKSRRILLIGDPGSGKTTLLQWIAVSAATNTFSEDLAQWKDKVPFFIKLREFTKVDLPNPEDFVKHNAPAIAFEMPEGWSRDLLRTGRAIVLVDGVDELSALRRTKVRDWIEDLVSHFPNAYYVITSRPYAASSRWLWKENFTSADLQRMNLTTINEFITRWHRAVKEELSEEYEKQELISLGENLKHTIYHNRSLRNLATNPLLCAMICALHRDRYQQLPTRRVALYEAACRMLLEERDKRRNIPSNQYKKLDYDQKKILLQRLAYWMLRNRKLQVDRSEAENQFSFGLKGLQGIEAEIVSSEIYTLFAERSGIVLEPEVDTLEFIHRTFLEYLAALAAVDERDIGVLIKNADDQQWRETIILSAGITDAKGRNELVSGLMLRGDESDNKRAASYLLAAACLETTIDIDPDVRSMVEQGVASLIPPKNQREAKAIAAAGELAAPYLVAKSEYNADISVMCIRTLMEIKGEIALESLSGYVTDKRKTVMSQLTRAWLAFESKEFALKVLSSGLELIFDGDVEIEGCRYLSNLTSVKISNNNTFFHLQPLERLSDLVDLEIVNCKNINTLESLAFLKNIRRLIIERCSEIKNIEPLANLSLLQYLVLRECDNIKDISSVSNCKDLVFLDIRNCSWISDLSPIAGLKQLRELILSDITLEENINLLKYMLPNLQIKIVSD